ncbi:hypothetical protein [uncultured Bradyrhizobium sp.]|uniref:hypothetical protein n=1 Tax=uncultured Bradyrhizobium sp. TaxID=199684 RepID=UPI0026346058|nr:hypothetical protein [uncultured Bradyrhizobium sp.]
MEDEKTRLLAEAQRCRRLAAISDPETVARLTALAEEDERRADAHPGPTDEKD